MKFVHPYIDREANMVLIEAVRGGKSMVKLEPPIVVFKEKDIYSDEIRETKTPQTQIFLYLNLTL